MYLIADVTDTIYFIGASDITKEGNWEWNGSKTPLVFTDWGHGQPDHLNHTENCLALRHAGFQWHDYPCHDHHRFICAAERKKNKFLNIKFLFLNDDENVLYWGKIKQWQIQG